MTTPKGLACLRVHLKMSECMCEVQALMATNWPKALFHHPLMAPRTLAALSEQALSVASVQIPAMYFSEDAGDPLEIFMLGAAKTWVM